MIFISILSDNRIRMSYWNLIYLTTIITIAIYFNVIIRLAPLGKRACFPYHVNFRLLRYIFPTYVYQFDDNAVSRPYSFHLWTTPRTSCSFVLHTACHTVISHRIISEHRRRRDWTKQHSAPHSSHQSVSHIQVKQDNYSDYNN